MQAPVNENGEEFEDPVDNILCMECGGAQDEDLTLLCEGLQYNVQIEATPVSARETQNLQVYK